MKKYINIFTILMAVVVFAMVLRVVDISNFVYKPETSKEVASANTKIENQDQSINLEKEKSLNIKLAFAEEAPVVNDNEPQKIDLSQSKDKKPYGETLYSEAELTVLNSLSDRRKEIEKREVEVARKEAMLKAAETEVDKKISDLIGIRKELVDLLDKQQTVQEDRVKSLVKIYEGMKPAQAAKIFDTLDMEILLAVIGHMKEKKSSSILEYMSPDKARTITMKLAAEYKLPKIP